MRNKSRDRGGSLAFQKIRNDVLGAVAAVPFGRVSTYVEIAEHLEIMPRHVSYILAMLNDEERQLVPWFRVLTKDGTVSSTNAARRDKQIVLLTAEHHEIDGAKICDLEKKRWHFPVRSKSPFKDRRGPYANPDTPLLYPKKSSSLR